MSGFYFLMPSLLTIFVSFLIVRAAAIALMMTGMDRNRAVFQALSSFSGTGFTTKEAERVINHPKRRKIISWLMILGNAGIVTVIITATSSLVSSKGYALPINIILFVAGIIVIYRIASHQGFTRKWEHYMEKKFIKHQIFEEDAVEDLLHLIEGYGLVRTLIKEDSRLIGSPLSACSECGEKVSVLGIEREKKWIPIPHAEDKILEGDRIIIYGPLDELKNLFREE